MITITTKINVTSRMISSLLCSAFEGGSNYWAKIVNFKAPNNPLNSLDDRKFPKHISYPMNEGGSLTVHDIHNDIDYILTLDKIQKGLELLAENKPTAFADIINDDADSETADMFLQFALLGRLNYG